MCQQLSIFEEFKQGITDPKLMIKKSGICKYCGSIMRVRPKYLDKRLGILVWDIYKHVNSVRGYSLTFRGDDIWQDYKKIADYQKLQYFGIIEKSGHCRWRLTFKGKRFLEGKISLPSRVFVLNNRIVAQEEQQITIDKLNSRWQSEYQDYVLDYFPQLKLNA